MRMRKGSRGVTLIELCFGVGVVALLAALAVPGFRSAVRTAAVRSATFELLAALHEVRAGSIVEARTGVLCLSAPDASCLADGPGNAGAHAWQSFLEVDGRPAPLAERRLPPGVVLRSSRTRLRFWPDSLAASTGTLTICDESALAPPRAIVLSQGGRARVTAAAETACS